MPVTKAANFTFDPQLAMRHIAGYFRRELVWGNLCWKLSAKKFSAPGKTLTFPYFGNISDAEKPGEDDELAVDSLGDNQFTATVYEVGKAVGITDSAMYEMGCTHGEWESEAHSQIGRVMAEQVDKDLIAEISKDTEHDAVNPAFVGDITIGSAFGNDKGANDAAFVSQLCNIRHISSALTQAFGDKRREAAAIVLHSEHYNAIETDVQAGFLQADANDPLHQVKGFIGKSSMFFGLPFFINDNVPEAADITVTDSGGTTQKYKTYNMVILKKDAYGLMVKQKPSIEYARNILKRQDIMSSTQWYAVKGFHKKINAADQRIAMARFATKRQGA